MISDTDAFVHIHIDTVRVVDYANVEMGCWVHVESSAWETSDRLRVWVTEENLAESFEQPTWDVDGVLAPILLLLLLAHGPGNPLVRVGVRVMLRVTSHSNPNPNLNPGEVG
jgi:hypothetical protein